MLFQRVLSRSCLAAIVLAGACAVGLAEDPPKPKEAAAQALTVQELSDLNAISVDLAFPLARDGKFGMDVDAAGPALRSQLDLPADQGVVVTSVVPQGAADASGIKANDVLLTISTKPIGTVEAFRQTLSAAVEAWDKANGVKQPLEVTLLRGGKRVNVEYKLVGDDATKLWYLARMVEAKANHDAQKYWLGVSVSEIDATLRSQLNLTENQGLIVTDVFADEPADKAGIKVHDVLLELRDKPLTSAEGLRDLVQEMGKNQQTANLKLLRGGKPATLSVSPVERKQDLELARWSSTAVSANGVMNLNLQPKFYVLKNGEAGELQMIGAGPSEAGTHWRQVLGMTGGKPLNLMAGLPAYINVATPPAPAAPADPTRELVEAIRQLTVKVEALEKAVQKSNEGQKP